MKGDAPFTDYLAMPAHVLARLESGRPSPSQERRKEKALAKTDATAPSSKTVAMEVADPFDAANAELAESSSMEDERRPAPQAVVHPPAAANGLQPPHFWTWRVLASGFSAEECQQIRGLTPDELSDQLLQAAQNGQPIDPRWVLSRQQIAALEHVISNLPADQIPLRLGRLPPGIKPRDVEIFLLAQGPTKSKGSAS